MNGRRPLAVLTTLALLAASLAQAWLAVSLPAAAQAATTSTPSLPVPGSTNPLSPGVPVAPVTSTTSPTPTVLPNNSTATSGSSSLSGSSAIGIAIGAMVVLVGISLFIWRDARRRAPARAARAAAGADTRVPGSKRTKPRKLSPAERRRRKRGRARR